MTTTNDPSASVTSPELLAPAGQWPSLRAAVANGADAVYFGLEDFNARRRAANFALAELPEVMDFLHRHNVRGYVTLNTLLFASELQRAGQFAQAVAQAGADAVIVQDLGLAGLIRRIAPDLPIHASTQMSLTEHRGIQLAAEAGISRVILARELTLGEIAHIRSQTGIPLEVFVHGALCMSYSGQCQASGRLFGASANRGQCDQPCRLPYRLSVNGREVAPAGPYVLSPKDLCLLENVTELTALGVAAFKIEGRLKNELYVAAAVRAYRQAIDAAVAAKPYKADAATSESLALTFSRGFSRGFAGGVDHSALVHGQTPKSIGLPIGRCLDRRPGRLILRLDAGANLKPGDGIMLLGEGNAGEVGGRVRTLQLGQAKGTVEVTLYDIPGAWTVALPCAIHKTADPDLTRRLEQTFSRDVVARPRPVRFEARGDVDRPLRLRAVDLLTRRSVEVASDAPLAAARSQAVSVELLRGQLGRLGETPFALSEVTLTDEAGDGPAGAVMAPKSLLNDLRRQAVERLVGAVYPKPACADAGECLTLLRRQGAAAVTAAQRPAPPAPAISLLVRTAAQAEAALAMAAELRPALLYLELPHAADNRRWLLRCAQAAQPAGLTTPRALDVHAEAALAALAEADPAAVLVRNLGSLAELHRRCPRAALVGDIGLHVANELTAGALLGWGLARLTPALELAWTELEAMLAAFPADRLELPAYHHAPLMHMRHCLYAANLAAGRPTTATASPRGAGGFNSNNGGNGALDRSSCGRPCRNHALALIDRTGQAHPVLVDGYCRNTLYHGQAGNGIAMAQLAARAGVRYFRIELLDEPGQAAAELMRDLRAAVR